MLIIVVEWLTDIFEVTVLLEFRERLLKLVDVGTADKVRAVETDTVGEILCEDWEVRELQPVPVTDDDTH